MRIVLRNGLGGDLDSVVLKDFEEGSTFDQDRQNELRSVLQQKVGEWVLEPGDTISIEE